jgi:hypothetical protein
MRRVSCIALLVAASALVGAQSAIAEGGRSIAAAPTVAAGQQEFGTIVSHGMGGCKTWWLLAVVAGDAIRIDWEVQSDHYVELQLFPPGTSDFNFPQTHPLVGGRPNENLKAELSYETSQTGDLPVLFEDPGCYGNTAPGPYSFTANITHALNASLPHVAVLPRKGVLTVAVHNPEGGAINNPAVQVELQIKGRGSWQRIGIGAVGNAAAVIPFKIPTSLRHKRVTLRALAHGVGYKQASSAHLKVRTL